VPCRLSAHLVFISRSFSSWTSLIVPSLPVNESPKFLVFLAGLGAFSLASFGFRTLSVLLQTFVLPGKRVCLLSISYQHYHYKPLNSSLHTTRKAHGQSSLVPLTESVKSSLFSWPRLDSMSCSWRGTGRPLIRLPRT
jgi:hypothetical protein